MRNFAFGVVFLALSAPLGAQGLLKVDGKEQPIRGINAPFIDGHFFANDGGSSGMHFDPVAMDAWFGDIESLHANAVRIGVFSFEDKNAPSGLIFDKEGYVKGIDPIFLKNFRVGLECAKKHHFSFYIGTGYPAWSAKSTKKDVYNDIRARNAFNRNAVGPLVHWLKGNLSVFAMEVVSEPEWGPDKGQHWAPYSQSTMRAFIQDGIRTVRQADPKRLVSFGALPIPVDNLEDYKWMIGLDVDFLDLHVYDNQGHLPSLDYINCGIPVILGEFGAEDSNGGSNNDTIINYAVNNFLHNSHDRGYAGTFYWSYGNDGLFRGTTGGGQSTQWRPVASIIRDFYNQLSHEAGTRTIQKRRTNVPTRARHR